MDKPPKEIRSDALGCTMHQVNDLREDAKKNGLAVEFKPDPLMIENGTPLFYQACFGAESERNRYAKHCGMPEDRSTTGGGTGFAPGHLEEAERRAKEMFPLD